MRQLVPQGSNVENEYDV